MRSYANRQGVKIIGDLPIFVAYDSSDVWAKPHLFELDPKGNPAKVAGVPPDYFSSTGQLWGNPHYRWGKMAEDDYAWWCKRFEQLLKKVGIICIDHFRGFKAYWEVPGEAKTVENGRWVKGPDNAFLGKIEQKLGKIPVIVEDLGLITQEGRGIEAPVRVSRHEGAAFYAGPE